MDLYKGHIPILDPLTPAARDILHPKGVRYGYVPRDYSVDPPEMFAPPDSVETIPQSEWDARYDEQEADESSLEHIFLRGGKPAFVNLDQNGDGHCWCYSTGHSEMFTYLLRGGRVPRLNPHFLASYLKTFNGGWCGKSMKAADEVGICEEGTGPGQWPLHLNDASRAQQQAYLSAAGQHKVVENIYDLTKQVYDQELTSLQLATCGFNNIAAPSDFNWWGHSVCQVRWVRIEKGSWGPLILNSWKGWGRFGLAVLRGSQAIADGAVATRTVS